MVQQNLNLGSSSYVLRNAYRLSSGVFFWVSGLFSRDAEASSRDLQCNTANPLRRRADWVFFFGLATSKGHCNCASAIGASDFPLPEMWPLPGNSGVLGMGRAAQSVVELNTSTSFHEPFARISLLIHLQANFLPSSPACSIRPPPRQDGRPDPRAPRGALRVHQGRHPIPATLHQA